MNTSNTLNPDYEPMMPEYYPEAEAVDILSAFFSQKTVEGFSVIKGFTSDEIEEILQLAPKFTKSDIEEIVSCTDRKECLTAVVQIVSRVRPSEFERLALKTAPIPVLPESSESALSHAQEKVTAILSTKKD